MGNFNVNLLNGKRITNRLQFSDTTNLDSFITFMKNTLKIEGEDYLYVVPEKTREIKNFPTMDYSGYVACTTAAVDQETMVRLTAADLKDLLGDKELSAYKQTGTTMVNLLKGGF